MKNPPPPALDWAAIRSRLAGRRGRHYWRGLEEVAETPEARQWLEREFPPGASEWPESVDRRSFLKLMGASLALAGLTGCTKPIMKEIVPYVRQPEYLVFGSPLYYATAMPLGGFGTGLLVKSREGRPIKADGNPKHPASLGGSNVWMQACLLDLYNPDRAQSVTRKGETSSWSIWLAAIHDALQPQQRKQGAGLRVLSGTVTSPTLAAQIRRLLQKYPEAKWHQYEPVNRDLSVTASHRAFGEYVYEHAHYDEAQVVLALDSDFLHAHPEHLRYARHFTDGRRVVSQGPQMNRLYALESTPSITGAMADHRLPLSSDDLASAALRLGELLGLPLPASASLSPATEKFLAQIAADLRDHRGKSIVTVGACQPAWLQEWAHRVNDHLGNSGHTLHYAAPSEIEPVLQVESLAELTDALRAGQVEVLLILSTNPVYDAPVDFNFAEALSRVPHSVHVSLEFNETSAACAWHIPQAHFLETWGDIRAYDGTATVQQPLIAPLFQGRSALEVLTVFEHLGPRLSDYDQVREYWRRQNLWPDFEQGWREAVQDGVIPGTQSEVREGKLRPADWSDATAELSSRANLKPGSLEVLFRPDPNIWDGQFASNPWLQEMPKPLTKLTWDNAILLSPKLAEERKLKNGDVVELRFADRWLRAPIWIFPGQAPDSITLSLGYGRKRAGLPGTGAGFDAYYARTAQNLWRVSGVTLEKREEWYQFATPQVHHRLHSAERQIYREGTLEEFQRHPTFVKSSIEAPGREETLYDPDKFDYPVKWGMTIDLTTCIGCNACTMACNLENNIPVVGKDQVAMGREMLWIRVDTYYSGGLDNPEFKHQPVPCMHCENAPCEYVCPVEATLHDHEGLNLQVYNRCIGTRYCSNNCPYKVRRFNFLGYNVDVTPLEALRNNPEVSVRSRGVMEKCTYCVQRIAAARINAGEEKRAIREGEVRTACQAACPTRAIVFGLMSDPRSEVAQYKRHALEYPMLGEENTRPRTTYLAKLQNPNPGLPSTQTLDEPEDLS